MLHAKSIEDSIKFYSLLGFELIDSDDCVPLGWARMHCEGGAIMFLRAEPEHPVEPNKQAVFFVMYTPDLPPFREHLIANGIKVPPIFYPEYMPSGSIEFRDPDGFLVCVHHWGKKEHEEWLKHIEKRGVKE